MNTLRKKRSLGIGVTLSNKIRRCKAKIALLSICGDSVVCIVHSLIEVAVVKVRY